MPKEFRTYFKEGKKPPKTSYDKQKKWNEMMARYAKKKKLALQPQRDADEVFYENMYDHFISEDNWRCANCCCELPRFDKQDKEFTFKIRNSMHHVLRKDKFKQFRHTPENILPLCYGFGDNCHGQAESAISLPKMKIYPLIVEIKNRLLNDTR